MPASFERLMRDIATCRICRDAPLGKKALPHEPRPVVFASPTAKILIAGQAPGTRVHKSGKPFTDPSGERLRAWMGIGEDVFYDTGAIAIVPMGFCFPGLDAKGGDLPPRRECAPAWRNKLMEQFTHLELVLVIGQYAQSWHLGHGRRKTLTETVQAWREFTQLETSPKAIPLPHPSWRNNTWLKKHPWFEVELLPYLRTEIARLVA
jgi:uracil-DNA glycosylase